MQVFFVFSLFIAGGTIAIFGNNFGVSGSVMIGSVVASVTSYSDTFIILPI